MSSPSAHPWFVGKRYGYGITPATWQGWAAIAVFEAALLLDLVVLGGLGRLIGAVLLAIAFIGLATRKTNDDWRWHWGRR